jgi:hypothetical protein
MVVVPNFGITTTQRPLLKIKLQQPLALGSQLVVLQGETTLGTATMSADQQGEPGLHYEYRHEGAAVGEHQYSAAVVTNDSTVTSPLYTITVAPPVLPTVIGVYEQEVVESGLFLSCPVFYDNAYVQQNDFSIRVVITPDEPSGTYYVSTNADANPDVLNVGVEVQHLTGNLTVYERMGSENHDWWDAVNMSEHNPAGTEWTLHWPAPSEKTSVAIVPQCETPH